MSVEPQKIEFDGAALRQMISAWCDGVINAADLRQLQSTLCASEEARQMFITLMQVHARMQGQSMAEEYLATFVPLPLVTTDSSGFGSIQQSPSMLQMVQLRARKLYQSRWAWAATLLVAATAFGAAQFLGGRHAPDAIKQQVLVEGNAQPSGFDSTPPGNILAKVTEPSDDCQWYLDKGSQSKTTAADGVRGGETIRVTNGRIKLVFNNGTAVTLHAPSLFQVISDMRARVMFGKVTAHIAKGAEGFSVLTPRGTVIDLGTEFGIEVNDIGATDLVVFQGEVNFDYISQDEGTARRQRLRTGEGMHLDASGTASRIVSITDQRYSEAPALASVRPPVITAVRDNIQRGAWNYYEIVQAGMQEDAKAFADREEHEWNGVTKDGMPSYLLGGDYVKTFNNDKVKTDIEITVKLDRAAKLYILFDNRIPAPQWLQEGFRPTGDEIGVDEGVYFVEGVWYTKHHPGKGPGVSVDHNSTIWVRDVKGPCCVKLGPTESTTVDINMYGIVAVPIEDAMVKTAAESSSLKK